jgi:type II secretory pathway pseudopilin PulG
MQYLLGIQGVQSGPFSENEIREKLAVGAIPANAVCWTEGWSEWRAITSVFPAAEGVRPPPLPANARSNSFQPHAVPSGPATTSGLAITSLVLGVVGLICVITSIPAVICGHIACSNIKQSNGGQKGRGLAITGLVLGYLIIAIMPIGLMAAMAIPAFQKVRSSAQEKTIINNLRQLDAAADQFMLENGVTKATYIDLVGDSPKHYIRQLMSVTGEDYTQLVIHANDREISVTTAQGRTISWSRHYTSDTPSFAPAQAQ